MKLPTSVPLALATIAASLVVGGAVAPAAASSEETCPAVVVLAARGSDQNEKEGQYFGPQRYSPGSMPSNGWEGPNWSAFFHYVEKAHPGVMDDVHVLGLDDQAYPAVMQLPPLAEEGEQLTSSQTSSRLWGVLTTHDIPALVRGVTVGALDSMRAGMDNAPAFVDAWEARTGCAPHYVVAGYSQGAIVGTSVERHLAAKGRLLGAIYLGNPLNRPRGLAAAVPAHLLPQPAALPAGRRINYCLDGDFACDLTVESAMDALSTKAEKHASYFLDAAAGNPTSQDAFVAETFVNWVSREN